MNIYKPIPFLVNWHNSPAAAFIRRHSWFFSGSKSDRLYAMSPYVALFIFVPTGAAILSKNRLLATAVLIFSLLHLFAWFLFVRTAVSKPPEPNE